MWGDCPTDAKCWSREPGQWRVEWTPADDQNGTYTLRTYADDGEFNESASTTVHVYAPPSRPRNVQASQYDSHGTVEVTWSHPLYDGNSPRQSYDVERGNCLGSWDKIATRLGAARTSYYDFSRPSRIYCYRVVAHNEHPDPSPPSMEARVVVLNLPIGP